ncbi:carbonic anhydrase [Meredithblackwellia eburnea MCA 4105]
MAKFPELQALVEGNRKWRNATDTALIEETALGQHPKIAFIGCSDSREPETTVFGAKIGDIFVNRNVGNQYQLDDLSSEAVISYAVQHVGVQHVIVMGHTSCGAVQASIASPANDSFTSIGWIRPIRATFDTSKRDEIVKFRQAHQSDTTIAGPNRTEPAFDALVEENVKYDYRTLTRIEMTLNS